ncbi:hypothetical protein LTR10_020378 [Elasticomyces elasticus]|uniref:Transcription factor domain-containing protein n=1 Tax=Exophiala sideris TaxID=1016849 RepID=A0ABR0JLJ2_9EURO|nr:hypothetical protein LTR10_020378 [Elasticomyces elasticus]KAK5036378.1 hypothetical protein LTS07_002105 [Exophiala sideris]KAK5041790.1 hypothetical protein LTR13_002457 [Exophiala sideris]KAK5066762.1 hypothetical protein LTR69_002109 [Exophiala sideris]KAK5184820.1 hypothetical protein LTR44_002666 [Eurotiomycetes sp. CCFEE 6388]
MVNMPLPCCENEFGLGKPQGGVSLKSGQSTQSIYAEVVRVMALWSAVVALVKQPEASLTNRLAEIQVLDGRIHEAYSKLSECFQLTSNNMSSTHLDDLPNLLLLHVMYQQCWCSLHSSIVPLFSWSVFDDNYSYAQQLSAQTAFEHANTVSSLLDTALKLNWDATRMPSFIGYAAYCACAIQTPFLWCLQLEVKQHAVRSVLANLKTLQVLGNHWKFLKVLGKYACHLYKVHASRPFPLADEPKNMTGAALKGIRPNARARLSILAHNTILVNEEGSFARIPEDIGDLSLNEAGSQNAALDNEENIAGFMSHISGEGRTVTNQLPVMMDPFLPSENLDYYDLSGAFHQPTGAQDMDSFGNIEDWISELLQHEA